MLKTLRKHAKYFYILFFLVIVTFIFWGVDPVNKSTGVPVATIGKEQITVDEYWRAYERAANLYKEIYKEKWGEEMEKKLNLRQKVLDSLINEKVIYSSAVAAGIKVTDRELQDSITNDPTFMREGAFDRDIYLKALSLSRITPQDYEAGRRRELIFEKMIRLITESIDLTPYEIKDISGDKALNAKLLTALIESKKEMALFSFVQGLRGQMEIKVNKELIQE